MPEFQTKSDGKIRVKVATQHSLDGQEGCCYKLDSSSNAVPITSITDIPHGIIIAVNFEINVEAGIYLGTIISASPFGGKLMAA